MPSELPDPFAPAPDQEDFLDLVFNPELDASSLGSRLAGFDAGAAGQETCALLPLLAARWREALPPSVRDQALQIHQFLGFKNRILFARLAEFVRKFRAAGIPVVLLKGAGLLQTCYPDPGLRLMGDADVMIRPEHLSQVLAMLGAEGYHWNSPRISRRMFAYRHSIDTGDDDRFKIDVHWRVLALVWHPGDNEDFWTRSRPSTLHGVETRVLSPEDQLLHLCVHQLSHFSFFQAGVEPDRPVRWIADAITLLRAAPTFDWDLFCREARARQFTLALGRALSSLRQRWAAPVPEGVLRTLAATPVSDFERADYEGLVKPRNASTGFQRGRLMWRRFVHANTTDRGIFAWAGFPAFLQHTMLLPSFPRFLGQIARNRFR